MLQISRFSTTKMPNVVGVCAVIFFQDAFGGRSGGSFSAAFHLKAQGGVKLLVSHRGFTRGHARSRNAKHFPSGFAHRCGWYLLARL